MDEVGRQVRRLREERGWNQAKLAVVAGMAPSAVNQIENGKRAPSANSLNKLAAALEVEVPDLFPKAQASAPPEESGQLDREKLVEWFDTVMKTPQPLSEQSDEAIAIFTEATERAARGEPAVAAGFLEDESPERNAIAEALARMLTEAEKRRHAEKSETA